MDRDYAEPLDLAVMARTAGYSKFHFARSFAAAYGESPAAYLRRRRIERAKQLLRGANLNVTDVCYMVGFESLGSFSRLFGQLVGQSRSKYRAGSEAPGAQPPIPGCFAMMWTRPHPDSAILDKSLGLGPG